MRKINPQAVWQDFEIQLTEQLDFFRRSFQALTSAQDRSISSENFALSTGVMFEGYVNDVIMAYVNKDCTQLLDHLTLSIERQLPDGKARRGFSELGSLGQRKHLNKAQLQSILDPDGRNTSFPSYDAIHARARQWLVQEHLSKFDALDARDKAVVNLAIAVRNNVAHRSKSSLDTLNGAVAVGALYQTGLLRSAYKVGRVGVYLKAVEKGETRAVLLAKRLQAASSKLVL